MKARSCLVWALVMLVSIPLAWVVFNVLIAGLLSLGSG